MTPNLSQPISAMVNLFVHAYEFPIIDSLLPVLFLCILLSSVSTLDNGPTWRLQLLHYAEDSKTFPVPTSLSASCSHFHISESDLLCWRREDWTSSWRISEVLLGSKGRESTWFQAVWWRHLWQICKCCWRLQNYSSLAGWYPQWRLTALRMNPNYTQA